MVAITFSPRAYQSSIARTAAQENTLVVLPTGLGKTNVFVMTAIERLNQHPKGKVLLLGPTRPLIDQYIEVFTKATDIPEEDMVVLTGKIKPEQRAKLFSEARIIFSTPQGLENDLITRRISMDDIVLIGFDEAHRAVGEYSYVWIAQQYEKAARYPRIIALTASPGTDKAKIEEVMGNLHLSRVEVRTADDPDVAPYVQKVDVKYEYVDLPDNLGEVIRKLKECFVSKVRTIASYLGQPMRDDMSRTELLKLQGQLQGTLAAGGKDFRVAKALSLAAEAMKVQHAVELAESQGVFALAEYCRDIFEKAKTTKTKATRNLAEDSSFRAAYARTLTLVERDVLHPKMIRLTELVSDLISINPDAKAIIFNNFRDNAAKLVEHLNGIDGVSAKLFVGQAKKRGSGLSQKDQKAMLGSFGAGEFNILVSTSIGEEGLDIPRVDSVIFYEPVPSTIRAIQRRGRTGRAEEGSVTILVTRNTRDEVYMWSARRKEQKMNRTLKKLSASVQPAEKQGPDMKLEGFGEVVIVADNRERGNPVVKQLIEAGVTVKLEQLEAGDYVLSKEVGVEFKTAEDFAQSLIDGRLLSQARALKAQYAKPIMVVEGFDSIHGVRNLHPNAIRGAISALAIDFGITLIPARNPKDAAGLLATIARREQLRSSRPTQIHFEKDPGSLSGRQHYLVSALPGIGPALAGELLSHFKTIRNLSNAEVEELQSVEKIGEKKAEAIKRIFTEEFEP